MRECEGLINTISSAGSSQEVVKNVQRQLAGRLQDFAQRQRLQQRTYLDKLKRVLAGDDVSEVELEESREEVMDDLSELDLQRNEQLDTLVNNLNELAYIFKDLATLVVEQGTLLDRIDYNLQEAAVQTRAGTLALGKVRSTQAEKYQRTARATMCILALVLLIVVLVLTLVLKHF
jgi:syntaxin 16